MEYNIFQLCLDFKFLFWGSKDSAVARHIPYFIPFACLNIIVVFESVNEGIL